MSARELWDSISRGNEIARLSERQRSFLIDLAKNEKIFDASNTMVLFPDGKRVRIREAYTKVGGYGGTIGKKPTGFFKAEALYLIQFEEPPGNTALYALADLDHFRRVGHKYKILCPGK